MGKDLFRYWSIRKREIKRSLLRLLLHIIAVICSTGAILLPLFFRDYFKMATPYEYFLFGYHNSILQINWIAVLFVFILFIGTGDYILVNIKRILEPSPTSIGSMLGKTARVHLKSGLLCADSLATSFELAKTDIDKAKKVLKHSLQQLLDSMDSIVQNHMDTVEKDDCITSNLFVALIPNEFDGRRWKPLEKNLKEERLYAEDGCESTNCIAWVRLVVQSHNSLDSFNLSQISFRINKQPTLAIPGVGNAYHIGLSYIQNDNLDIGISAINDVTRIQWPADKSNLMQKKAIEHFNNIDKIKSFISIPLISFDEVIGILNINSISYYLAGRSGQQRSVMENLIFPCIPYLADMLQSLRRLAYGV